MAKRSHYTPVNAEKYTGRYPIVLKSSWEEHFARIYCDLNTSCLEWAYEPWKIPYHDPINDRQTIYIPDFLMSIRSNAGRVKTVLVEIKPLHEWYQSHARNMKDSAVIARNMAKQEAAIGWCARRTNVEFCVLTEADLFPGGQNIKPRKNPVRGYAKRRIKK
jgi:hypothetical protein